MGGIRHWGAVELHGLRSLTCTPHTGKGESRARCLHLLRPKGIFPSSCIKGALSSAEQGAASHRHLLPEGFALLVATGRISRSPLRRHCCCLHRGRRGIRVLTSRPLMRKTNSEAGRRNAVISRACSDAVPDAGSAAGAAGSVRHQSCTPQLG